MHRYKLCFIATALSAGLRSYPAVGRGVFKEMNVSLRDGWLWVFGGRRWSPRAALFVILARVVVEVSNVCLAVEEVRVVVFKVR